MHSRRAPRVGRGPSGSGDQAIGDGIREEVAGADAVIHAATNSRGAQRGGFKPGDFFQSPGDVDVERTKALLVAAGHAEVGHFLHVSIVGLERVSLLAYSRRKLQAEALVHSSQIPWSIVRATVFYWLRERVFGRWPGSRVLALPTRVAMTPVDSDELATLIAGCG